MFTPINKVPTGRALAKLRTLIDATPELAHVTPAAALSALHARLGDPSIRAGFAGYGDAELVGLIKRAVADTPAPASAVAHDPNPEVADPAVKAQLGNLRLRDLPPDRRLAELYAAQERAARSNTIAPREVGTAEDPRTHRLAQHFALQAAAHGNDIAPPKFAEVSGTPMARLTIAVARGASHALLRELHGLRAARATQKWNVNQEIHGDRRIGQLVDALKKMGVENP